MEWVTEFLAAHPLVRLDFVLSERNPNHVVRRIHSHVIGLFASPAYLAARGTPVELQDLADHDCIAFSSPRNHATWRLQGPDGLETEVVVSDRFMANTAQALRRAALDGLGIALMPAMVTGDVAGGQPACRFHTNGRESGLPARPRPLPPKRANQVWSYDFRVRHLRRWSATEVPVTDEFTKEGLAIDVAGSIRSARVIEVLSRIVSERGAPDYLRSDNGPEFVSHALLAWIRSQGIGTA